MVQNKNWKLNLVKSVVLVCVFLGMDVMSFTPVAGKYYRIVFEHSGKCIRPKDASTGNVVTEQWEIDETDESQLWHFESHADAGYYIAINKKSNKAFDIWGRDPHDLVGLWTIHRGTNQQIRFETASTPGYHLIYDRRNNQTLDVAGNSQDNGAGIISYPHHGGANQRVQFVEEVTGPTPKLITNEAFLSTTISSWQSGNTANNLAKIVDGDKATSGSSDYQIHPTNADGKNILFTWDTVYTHGSFKFYNRTGCCQNRITNSTVEFLLEDDVQYSHTISASTNEITVVPGESVSFNKVKLTFSGSAQNFREIEIQGIVSYSKQKLLRLNANKLGVTLTQDIVDFPLLVRLNENNFSFEDAKANGEDLRFVSNDGTDLNYYIESWDGVNKTADIWIQTTIRQEAGDDSIWMRWGNPEAEAKSNSASVFSSENGFAGAWGMQNLSDKLGQNNGTGQNLSTSNYVNGIVGKAVQFNGNNQSVCIDGSESSSSVFNFSHNGNYTVSGWVRPNSLAQWKSVITKGEWQYMIKIANNNQWTWEVLHPTKLTYLLAPATMEWTHVVGVITPTKQYMYLNGDLVAERDNAPNKNWGTLNSSGKLCFAEHRGGQYFNGIVDEVQVSKVSRSSEWLKLSYETQKTGSEAVQFGNIASVQEAASSAASQYDGSSTVKVFVPNGTSGDGITVEEDWEYELSPEE